MAKSLYIKNSREIKGLLPEAKPGDMIQFERGIYSHWAIYVGDGMVIHRWGEDDGIGQAVGFWGNITTFSGAQFNKATIIETTVVAVLGENGKARVNNYRDVRQKPLPVYEIVDRARKALTQVGYNLMYQNCEHFATECRYGQANSQQVQMATIGVGVLLVAGTGLIAYALAKSFSSSDQQDKDKKTKKARIKES